MAYGRTIDLVGNATRDPELSYIGRDNNIPVCKFGIAVNETYEVNGEKKEKVHFFDVVCWRRLAENVANTIVKGDRVVVFGAPEYQSWQDNGQNRSKIEINAAHVGVDLSFATATIQKNPKADGAGGNQPPMSNYEERAEASAPASAPAPRIDYSYNPDEEPF